MHRGSRLPSNPELEISFNSPPKQPPVDYEERLRLEILRVEAVDKLRAVGSIWSMGQHQLCNFFAEYPFLPETGLTSEQLLNSQRLKLVRSEGKVYFGEVGPRGRHGRGVCVEKEGKLYEGRFVQNQRSGEGVEIYPNGNVYIGSFHNDKKHGEGTFYWFTLTSHSLEPDATIEHYQGNWWGGLPHQMGQHFKANGDVYRGAFKNGLKHGRGEEQYSNGDCYNGLFGNGFPQGQGEYLWSDGSLYKGEFRQGKRFGYGLWHSSNGDSYSGQWVDDRKEGYGVFEWKNGWSYRGHFESDKRHGQGELFDSHGRTSYKGEWNMGEKVDRAAYEEREREASISNYRSVQLARRSLHKKQQEKEKGFERAKSTQKITINPKNQDEYATYTSLRELNSRPSKLTRPSSASNIPGVRFRTTRTRPSQAKP